MLVFPPGVPFTSHFTAVLVVPVTVALNCPLWPDCKVRLAGEIETETVPGVGEGVGFGAGVGVGVGL